MRDHQRKKFLSGEMPLSSCSDAIWMYSVLSRRMRLKIARRCLPRYKQRFQRLRVKRCLTTLRQNLHHLPGVGTQTTVTNVSGGVNLDAQRDAHIGGDVVGYDKPRHLAVQ
jgi:hypothetical protein